MLTSKYSRKECLKYYDSLMEHGEPPTGVDIACLIQDANRLEYVESKLCKLATSLIDAANLLPRSEPALAIIGMAITLMGLYKSPVQ